MSKRLYVDINIFMDFIENRFHLDVFEKSLSCQFIVVISQLVLNELHYQEKKQHLRKKQKTLLKLF